MPMYEFVCQECSRPFETLVPMAQADKQQVCPACGSQQTRRQLSSFAVSGGSSRTAAPAAPARSRFT